MRDITKMDASDIMLRSTVRIEAYTDGLDGMSVGTGFLFDFGEPGVSPAYAIVTNIHVLGGYASIRYAVSILDSEGRISMVPVTVDDVGSIAVAHPEGLDLCAIPIPLIGIGLNAISAKPLCVPLDASCIPGQDFIDDLHSIETVTMVGYPAGLYDSANNMPVARQGITATPLEFDYEGRPEFLIDVACFPGSSGSPVFVYDNGFRSGRGGLSIVAGPPRISLVGVVQQNRSYVNSISVDGVEVAVPDAMNLACAIKAPRLLDMSAMVRDACARQLDSDW